eukprot:TRINITY_DN44749_c0_g1_i1.p1 TRINITY_DN44749_c0_g1~~TRINITY_DN44749_c0_g1_i1.p1  ORF type:complete len:768 (-),score=102.43 TRINITY_DN44749_c0_g1_i1:2694-4997(-)
MLCGFVFFVLYTVGIAASPSIPSLPSCIRSAGSADCPCVDFSVSPWFDALRPYIAYPTGNSVQCPPDTFWNPPLSAQTQPYNSACLPLSYLFGCARHDLYVDTRCSTVLCTKENGVIKESIDGSCAVNDTRSVVPKNPRPSFCDGYWCFVNASECPASRRPISTPLGVDLNLSLAWSFRTCGDLEVPEAGKRVFSAFSNRALTVGVPRGYPSVDLTVHAPGCTAAGRYAQFLESIAEEANTTLQYRCVSASSEARFPGDSFTACVYDVAIGDVDICVGPFWVTEERIGISRFSAPVAMDTIYLIVDTNQQAPSLWTKALLPFAPFSGPLWAMIVGVVLLVAMAMDLFERVSPAVRHAVAIDRTATLRLQFPGHGLIRSFLFSAHSFLGTGAGLMPMSVPGLVILTAFGVFVVLTMASFTANTTQYLLTRARQAHVSSVDELLSTTDQQVCALPSLASTLTGRYPAWASRFRFDAGSNASALLAALDTPHCGGVLLPEEALYTAYGSGEHCSKQAVGKPVLTFGNSLPVLDGGSDADADDLGASIGAWVVHGRIKGYWQQAVAGTPFPSSRCGEEDDSSMQQLEPVHFLSPVLLVVGSIGVAAAIHFVYFAGFCLGGAAGLPPQRSAHEVPLRSFGGCPDGTEMESKMRGFASRRTALVGGDMPALDNELSGGEVGRCSRGSSSRFSSPRKGWTHYARRVGGWMFHDVAYCKHADPSSPQGQGEGVPASPYRPPSVAPAPLEPWQQAKVDSAAHGADRAPEDEVKRVL